MAVSPLSPCKLSVLPASLQEGGEGQRGGEILCYGGSSAHCRMSSSTLDLYDSMPDSMPAVIAKRSVLIAKCLHWSNLPPPHPH